MTDPLHEELLKMAVTPLVLTPKVLELASAIAYHNQKVRELDIAKSEVVRLTREILGQSQRTDP